MSEIDKKEVLSQTLEGIRRSVDRTEFEPVEGVNADALDVVEGGSLLSRLARKILAAKAAKAAKAPTIPLKITSQMANQTPKSGLKLLKTLAPIAKRIPPAELAVLMYETAALANSEEAREKAKKQAEDMYKRGNSVEGMGKNALQGFLDPAGTIYAAGDAAVDTVKTLGGLANDKLFGPSEEEQREAAKRRINKRNRNRRSDLRREKMSPEERAESADRAISSPDHGDLQKESRRATSPVHSPYDKKADDLRRLMEKPYDGLTKRPR